MMLFACEKEGIISEKVSFEVYIVDRADNQSNIIETDEIIINQ